jgi:hypothetical protein
MPDDSTACRIIMDELERVNNRLDTLVADVSDLKRSQSISEGERGALAKIGGLVVLLCTAIGALVSVSSNWGKLTGHQ